MSKKYVICTTCLRRSPFEDHFITEEPWFCCEWCYDQWVASDPYRRG